MPNGKVAPTAANLNGAATGTQVVLRTLAILEVFQNDVDELGISDIAERLDLSGSTVHRLVRALTSAGYLAQNEETERYYLGRSAVLLGQAAGRRLGLHLAQPVIERLRDETGESVNLGVRDGDEMVVVMRVESRHPLRFSQDPGSRLPIFATGMGKATMSRGDIDKELKSLPSPLWSLAPNTITSVQKLREELVAIRRRGFSFDNEEAISGVRCVASAITAPSGQALAAIAVQGPTVRMPRSRLKELAPLATAAAKEIAELLPQAHPI